MKLPTLQLDRSRLSLDGLRSALSRPKAPAATAGPPNDVKAFRPAPPRADLLPESVRVRAANRRSRAISIASVSAVGVALAGVWGSGSITQTSLQDEIDTAQTHQSVLNAELAVFAPVTNLATQTEALTLTVGDQTALEVSHADALARFLNASAGTMDPTTVTINTAANSACATTDPFNQVATAGCITFTGTDLSGTGASAVVRALGEDEWFTNAFVPTVGAATEDSGASLSGTVALTTAAYTNGVGVPEAVPDDTTTQD